MIKLLLFVLVCFVFYALLTSLLRPTQGRGRFSRGGADAANRSVSGEAMVKDPQCGTYLPVGDAIRKTVRGQECYFCSNECFEKYKATHKH
jgi:YHS domain-containing protein